MLWGVRDDHRGRVVEDYAIVVYCGWLMVNFEMPKSLAEREVDVCSPRWDGGGVEETLFYVDRFGRQIERKCHVQGR